ncbi:MAG: LysR family transcriptional regulator [Comamonadaceae bacterium]|nr:LysR family transcriptional regulator [Comamonadaceae bacterium]
MSNVTLRQLQAFATVAELGSFVRAAAAMHITASALSTMMAELEHSVGLRLLDRTTRRVSLSSAGEQYLPYAQHLLKGMDTINRVAIELRSQLSGRVRIATSQVIAWTLMPPLLLAYRKLRPDVQLELMDLPVDDILPSLESGRADLAIILPTDPGPELQAETLFKTPVFLVCHSGHLWAGRKSLRWAEVIGEPLIFTGVDTSQRINAVLPESLRVQATTQVDHAGTAMALAASGLGCAICAEYVRPLTRMHRLKMIALVEPTVSREFALYTSRRRSLAPAVAGFREFLIEQMGTKKRGA